MIRRIKKEIKKKQNKHLKREKKGEIYYGVDNVSLLRNQLKDYSNDNLVICDIKNEAFRISGNIIHLLNNEVKDNVDEITMSWDDIFSMICGTSKEKILK